MATRVNDNMTRTLPSSRWALVLAGGDGTRMQGVMEEWFGEVRPKQFCSFVGRRSMIEHTWERALGLVSADHIVTVAVNKHRKYFEQFDATDIPGCLLYQPLNRGTATAIFFGVAYILARDPDAEVIILPSDHYIAPREKFIALAERAFELNARHPEGMIVLAARPWEANPDYGWMSSQPDDRAEGLGRLADFVEKPDRDTATRLFTEGAQWSTMICMARADTLWQLGQIHLPVGFSRRMDYIRELTRFFGEGYRHADLPGISVSLMLTYYQLPVVDFSGDFLRAAAYACRVMALDEVDWDDWGRPERVVETIRRHALAANFRAC